MVKFQRWARIDVRRDREKRLTRRGRCYLRCVGTRYALDGTLTDTWRAVDYCGAHGEAAGWPCAVGTAAGHHSDLTAYPGFGAAWLLARLAERRAAARREWDTQ